MLFTELSACQGLGGKGQDGEVKKELDQGGSAEADMTVEGQRETEGNHF